MKTSFARGTVYGKDADETLAEVYYFIQGALPNGAACEYLGFLEPVVEYEPLAEILQASARAVLELEDGTRLAIEPSSGSDCCNDSLPIFFRAVAHESAPESRMTLTA